MRQYSIETRVSSYDSLTHLPEEDQLLMKEAIAQLDNSYAPYSNFRVGAALRLQNGKLIGGSNQENASYPLCMCAERVAIYNAATQFPGEAIDTLAITVTHAEISVDKPVAPCGACRQVICEFETKQSKEIRILLKGESDEVLELSSGKSLLPLLFDGSFLLG